MRILGLILIAFGLALLLFVGFNFLQDRNRTISPLPQESGVKVIFVTPTK